ncbi:hypothetical protein [Paractinoplanes brasiliensis]|uniref:hypothetical protein n=1 Tax=Paractinoplanes brasiliensis TaxID=52695 RepID=UPI001060D0D2|nr:hypothetical protein [Actinoplanes brasiliensis]GID32510.1 hypothetical protein Abr02nite_74930 [Actinoplanes brasiliensis]
MAAYAVFGAAALHPSSTLLAVPGRAPDDDLTPPASPTSGRRCCSPLPADGILVTLSSAALVPLVGPARGPPPPGRRDL